jgi:hypothetical protein
MLASFTLTLGLAASDAVATPSPTVVASHDTICRLGDRGWLLGYERVAASRKVLASLRVERTDKLFTCGFSQGGHSALAVHRALQNAGVEVTATAAVGGVYDVERWFLGALDNEAIITPPLYVAYLLLAYDDIYDVYEQTSDVFRRPYESTVSGLFDMQHFWDDVLAGLPSTSRAHLRRSYFDVLADPDNGCVSACARTR